MRHPVPKSWASVSLVASWATILALGGRMKRNIPVLETLYRTNAPEELERAEYYQPHIESKFHDGKWFFVVTETHAWYDDKEKKVVNHVTTLNPDATEGYAKIEEAWKSYDEQVRRRVSDGFVHSFSIEFDSQRMAPVHIYKQLS